MNHDRYRLRESLRVRWAETDMQGIVFNGHYLTYFDVAITEYWRAIGMPYPAAFAGTGVDLFAVKSTVEYLAPARYDDMIEVGCRAARLGRSSIGFALADLARRRADHQGRGRLRVRRSGGAARDPDPRALRSAIEAFEKA